MVFSRTVSRSLEPRKDPTAQRRARRLAPAGRRWTLVASALTVLATHQPRQVHADGAFPDSQSILTPLARPEEVVLVTNFGLVSTEDAGTTWLWSCEQDANALGRLYQQSPPPLRRLYAVANQELVFSDDEACGWTPAVGLVSDQNVTDAFADRTTPGRVFAVGSHCCEGGATVYRAFASTDAGATFGDLLFAADGGETITGIEAAAADPMTVYLTIAGAGSPPAAILARSVDGGASWMRSDLSAQIGAGVLRIIAVDPADPRTVFLLRTGAAGQAVAITKDGGATAVNVLEPDGMIMNFIRLASGTVLVATDLNGVQGLFRSQDDVATFQAVFDPPHVRAFSERSGILYAATYARSDGYAIGVSMDEGTTWRGLMSYADISAIVPCLKAACQNLCSTEVGLQLFSSGVCTADAPTSSGSADAGTPPDGGAGAGGAGGASPGPGAGATGGGAATTGGGGATAGSAGTAPPTGAGGGAPPGDAGGGSSGGAAAAGAGGQEGCQCETTATSRSDRAGGVVLLVLAGLFRRCRRRVPGRDQTRAQGGAGPTTSDRGHPRRPASRSCRSRQTV
jgi:MYXO-CTERM domain-containing protein